MMNSANTMEKSETFLGIEISTQQGKAIVINGDFQVLWKATVNFDTDLSGFSTSGGVHKEKDGLTVTSPVLMWVAAVDTLLKILQDAGADFKNIAGVSGNGQQHGSVYWKTGSEKTLAKLDARLSLADQLNESFSLADSPIWMDSSTSKQCSEIENAAGGAIALSNRTGSRAFERFTGSQIMKVREKYPEMYSNTGRISLVSSFLATLLIGKFAPIDFSDASGMNLMDIRTKKWVDECVNVVGPDLVEKLGNTVDSSAELGNISSYFTKRYGFPSSCKVVAFTGDNPATLAGLVLGRGDAAVSLGTSGTLSMWIDSPRPGLKGHVFVNPIDSRAYMGMLCFKNGALTRERIRNHCAEKSWDRFEEILESTPPGNNGNIGFYFDLPEIIPTVAAGDYRFDSKDDQVESFPPSMEVRACIEGQMLAKRVHATDLGLQVGSSARIFAAGGGSRSKKILQILSDVFQAPVYAMEDPDVACIGCAFRAYYNHLEDESKPGYSVALKNAAKRMSLVCTPNSDNKNVYDEMAARVKKLEEKMHLIKCS